MEQLIRIVAFALVLALSALSGARAQDDVPVAPFNLVDYRGELGELRFWLTGSTAGFVYGDGIYSDDSSLAAAAVHAGVLVPEETAVVTVELLGPQDSFDAATRNGIVSSSFGAWSGSFRFAGAPDAADAPPRLPGLPLPDPGSMSAYPGETGELVNFNIIGAETGVVYGDGIYTADSVIARAAVHAGLVAPGESRVVTVEVLGAQDSFAASDRNGVKTTSWGPYHSAYRFIEFPLAAEATPIEYGSGTGPGPRTKD